MTDEQLKKLAEIVLANEERLDLMTACVGELSEALARLSPPGAPSIRLAFLVEQQEAALQHAEKEREERKRFFGIGP